jgi:hypothetical protein
MTFNNFDTIIVTPRSDLAAETVYGLLCHNTITPATPTDPALFPKVSVKSGNSVVY